MAGMRGRYLAAFLLCLLSIAGAPHGAVDAQSGATVTILHINDVYEIDAIEGGRYGGLSRAATVLQRLERRALASADDAWAETICLRRQSGRRSSTVSRWAADRWWTS